MSRRGIDWDRDRSNAVRSDAARAKRVDGIVDAAIGVLCENCAETMQPGTPVKRIDRKTSPSGEGGYVHDPMTCKTSEAWFA